MHSLEFKLHLRKTYSWRWARSLHVPASALAHRCLVRYWPERGRQLPHSPSRESAAAQGLENAKRQQLGVRTTTTQWTLCVREIASGLCGSCCAWGPRHPERCALELGPGMEAVVGVARDVALALIALLLPLAFVLLLVLLGTSLSPSEFPHSAMTKYYFCSIWGRPRSTRASTQPQRAECVRLVSSQT